MTKRSICNGKSSKTVLTGDAALRIDIPRDRSGSFEPQIMGKYPATTLQTCIVHLIRNSLDYAFMGSGKQDLLLTSSLAIT